MLATPTHGSALLDVRALTLQFKGVKALGGVSFGVQRGEIFSIIGPNGAGKTSLLNCVSGRYAPTGGAVLFGGHDVTHVPAARRARLGIGRTFQNLALFSRMTVLENIMVGRHCHLKNNFLTAGLWWLGGAQSEEMRHREDVERIIDFLEIEHIRHSIAGTLSYGLRKRVELARAMALKPRLLLLDEPMAGMYVEEKEDIARYIVELRQYWDVTIAMIEHDMAVVADISDRVMVLHYGEKLAEGTPAEVLAHPMVKRAYLGADDLATVEAKSEAQDATA